MVLIQDIKPAAKVSIAGKVHTRVLSRYYVAQPIMPEIEYLQPGTVPKPIEIKTKTKYKVEAMLIFKVAGKLYPGTKTNRETIDTYMHTGNPDWLKQLEVAK